jgi:lipoate-protein ligase A
VELLRGPLPSGPDADQAREVAMAQAMMRRVARGAAGPMLRVYRPTGPAVAFGRRDVRLPGFEGAVSAVRRAGFSPCVRAPGGRAVAYTTEALVVDHVSPDPEWPSGLEGRFAEFGDLWAGVLRDLGVDTRIGEVPGEYCPGAWSVNVGGKVKVMGVGQRLVRGAAHIGGVVVVDEGDRIRDVLIPVYRALGLDWDPRTAGSLADRSPGITVKLVMDSIEAQFRRRFEVVEGRLPPAILAEADALVADHLPNVA